MADRKDRSCTRVRVGSRSSELAMKQTRTIIAALKEHHPEVEFIITTMETIGDKILDKPLPNVGTTNLFTKELEFALASNEVDMIVHSLKDVPTSISPDFTISAISKREDPTDALLLAPKHKEKKSLIELSPGSVVGTSSLRRVAQLKRCCPHLEFKSIRGNLNTRLRKLDESGEYDAAVMATAGLERLGWQDRITAKLDPSLCMYAVGQGALAVETRCNDHELHRLLDCLNHPPTVLVCSAERGFLHRLEGGCSVPVGVCSGIEGVALKMTGAVFSLDGSQKLDSSTSMDLPANWMELPYSQLGSLGEGIGEQLAQALLDKGAGAILKEAKRCSEMEGFPKN